MTKFYLLPVNFDGLRINLFALNNGTRDSFALIVFNRGGIGFNFRGRAGRCHYINGKFFTLKIQLKGKAHEIYYCSLSFVLLIDEMLHYL
tara:strand:- start:151 stop:420 length:270 start_codon:yes stop_codon:yes gene_type:complete